MFVAGYWRGEHVGLDRKRGAGLFEPDAGPEAADDAELVTIPCLEQFRPAARLPCLRRSSIDNGTKPDTRSSDSRPANRSSATPMMVNACPFMRTAPADDGRVAAESATPVFMRQDHDGRARVGRHQHAPGRGTDAKQREGVLGHRFQDDPLDAASGIEPRALQAGTRAAR